MYSLECNALADFNNFDNRLFHGFKRNVFLNKNKIIYLELSKRYILLFTRLIFNYKYLTHSE